MALVFSLAVKKVAHLALINNVLKKGGELKEIVQLVGTQITVSGPHSATCLDWTPMIDSCVLRYGSQNGHQKDVCFKLIGDRAQKLLTMRVNTMGLKPLLFRLILKKKDSSLLMRIRVTYRSFKTYEENGYSLNLDSATILTLIACSMISYKGRQISKFGDEFRYSYKLRKL